ncbi:hypothetical protein, partial [Ascidiimonas sp. W6]|uniref:hypothetical protein n=1 Tax=Ascidiimonas meishanensis TaxID=3128903 RepID=UPI0030EF3B10
KVIEAQKELREMESHSVVSPVEKGRLEAIIKENTLKAKEVVIGFLEKIPLTNIKANGVYIEGAVQLLDPVFNESTSDEDKKTALQTIATALGDCATPVKDILTVAYVASYGSKSTSEEPSKEVQAVIVREAVEKAILTELSALEVAGERVFNTNEFIEQVKGLSNAIFLNGAAEHPNNKVKILFPEGTKPQTLPSKTAYEDFAFKVVKDELAIAFAKLCCITNDDAANTLVQDSQQRYTFDKNKLNSMVEKYYTNVLGDISPKNKAIEKILNQYKADVSKILEKSGLIDLTDEPEVLPVLDITKQATALRQELTGADTHEIEEVSKMFLAQQTQLIEKMVQKYDKQIKEVAEPTESALLQDFGKLMMATNSDKDDKRKVDETKRDEEPKRKRTRSKSPSPKLG